MQDFGDRLLAFSREAVKLAVRCQNEQATKQYLILPFIRLMGFDDANPNDVVPEHEADFSEKYKNRVDFALLCGGQARIAVECKSAGARIKDDHGQLRSYFNAMLPVNVGVLTNGLEYEFYVDSVRPNVMDGEPYFSINLADVDKGTTPKKAIKNLFALTKEQYNAEAVMERARRQLLHDALAQDFIRELKSPTDDLCRYFLKKFDVSYLSKKQLDEIYRSIVKGAFEEALADHIFKRLRLEWPSAPRTLSATEQEADESPIETTHRELAIYSYCRRRLSFLVDSDHLFDEIEKISYKDYLSKFVVFYDKPWKGKLFEFIEGDDGYDTFVFPDEPEEIRTNNMVDLDGPLLKAFKARVSDISAVPFSVVSA